MKMVALWSAIVAFAFVAMSYHMGTFGFGRAHPVEPSADEEKPESPKVTANSPNDLPPPAPAHPVPAAAPYNPGSEPHPLVFLRLSGVLHPWQETLREDWQAETVATTELVVVVGTPKKMF